MTLSEFADTYSWTQSLDLGPHLLSLADELPAAESTSIGVLLRQLAVEIPAGVAANLLADAPADLTNVLKLMTALELIERVYPVIEVAESRRRADALAERLSGDTFTEKPKPAEIAALPDGMGVGDDEDKDEDKDKDDDKPGALSDMPAGIEITPAPAKPAGLDEPTSSDKPAAPSVSAGLAAPVQVHPAESIQPLPPAPSASANPFSISIKPAVTTPETPEESHVHPDSEQ